MLYTQISRKLLIVYLIRDYLTKLKSFAFVVHILNWIKSFLTGRMQRVVVKGDFSHWMNVLSGVPQGSVLGPLLFLLYINDIVDNLKCNTYLFDG